MKKILTIAILGFVCHSLHSWNKFSYNEGDHGVALYEFIMYDYDNRILPLGTTQSRIASNVSDAESMTVTFSNDRNGWYQTSWGIGRLLKDKFGKDIGYGMIWRDFSPGDTGQWLIEHGERSGKSWNDYDISWSWSHKEWSKSDIFEMRGTRVTSDESTWVDNVVTVFFMVSYKNNDAIAKNNDSRYVYLLNKDGSEGLYLEHNETKKLTPADENNIPYFNDRGEITVTVRGSNNKSYGTGKYDDIAHLETDVLTSEIGSVVININDGYDLKPIKGTYGHKSGSNIQEGNISAFEITTNTLPTPNNIVGHIAFYTDKAETSRLNKIITPDNSYSQHFTINDHKINVRYNWEKDYKISKLGNPKALNSYAFFNVNVLAPLPIDKVRMRIVDKEDNYIKGETWHFKSISSEIKNVKLFDFRRNSFEDEYGFEDTYGGKIILNDTDVGTFVIACSAKKLKNLGMKFKEYQVFTYLEKPVFIVGFSASEGYVLDVSAQGGDVNLHLIAENSQPIDDLKDININSMGFYLSNNSDYLIKEDKRSGAITYLSNFSITDQYWSYVWKITDKQTSKVVGNIAFYDNHVNMNIFFPNSESTTKKFTIGKKVINVRYDVQNGYAINSIFNTSNKNNCATFKINISNPGGVPSEQGSSISAEGSESNSDTKQGYIPAGKIAEKMAVGKASKLNNMKILETPKQYSPSQEYIDKHGASTTDEPTTPLPGEAGYKDEEGDEGEEGEEGGEGDEGDEGEEGGEGDEGDEGGFFKFGKKITEESGADDSAIFQGIEWELDLGGGIEPQTFLTGFLIALPFAISGENPVAQTVVDDVNMSIGLGLALATGNPISITLGVAGSVISMICPSTSYTSVGFELINPLYGGDFELKSLGKDSGLSFAKAQEVTKMERKFDNETTLYPDHWGIGGNVIDPDGNGVGMVILWSNWEPGGELQKFINNAPRAHFDIQDFFSFDISLASSAKTKSSYKITHVNLVDGDSNNSFKFQVFIGHKSNDELATAQKSLWVVNNKGLFLQDKTNKKLTPADEIPGFNPFEKVNATVTNESEATVTSYPETFSNYINILTSLPSNNQPAPVSYQGPSKIIVKIEDFSGKSIPFTIGQCAGTFMNMPIVLNYKFPHNEEWAFGASIHDSTVQSLTGQILLRSVSPLSKIDPAKVFGVSSVNFTTEKMTYGDMEFLFSYQNHNGYIYNIQDPKIENNEITINLTFEPQGVSTTKIHQTKMIFSDHSGTPIDFKVLAPSDGAKNATSGLKINPGEDWSYGGKIALKGQLIGTVYVTNKENFSGVFRQNEKIAYEKFTHRGTKYFVFFSCEEGWNFFPDKTESKSEILQFIIKLDHKTGGIGYL